MKIYTSPPHGFKIDIDNMRRQIVRRSTTIAELIQVLDTISAVKPNEHHTIPQICKTAIAKVISEYQNK